MDYLEKYEEWCKNPVFDESTKQELLSLKGNDKEIKDLKTCRGPVQFGY